jgi:ATP-binding cassette subfamily B protein
VAAHAHVPTPTQFLRGNEWRVLGTLVPYLLEYRWRVLLALVLLVAAKLTNVAVPLVMKEVVDGLDPKLAVLAVPAALLAAYGLLRFSTTLFAELRDVVFVRVTQRAIRRVALGVFRHLHSLSLRFHLERQTGGMTRDIERGTRGISTLLSYLIFSILPVILEFALVAAVLLAKFDWRFAAITFGAVAVYLTFTFLVSEWRIAIRKRANELDSKANTRAIDSLLNYETVKYFGNEEFEAGRYDDSLRRYESAATTSEASRGRRPRRDRAHVPRRRGRGDAAADARRPGAGERAADPALHPAQLPRHGVPRDQAVARRHGAHVPAAGGEPGSAGQAGRARPGAGAGDGGVP